MKRNEDLLIQMGARIAYLRKERHMSQLDLAVEAEVAKTYLCDLEKGRRNPTVCLLNRIAVALSMNLDDLFDGIICF